jgi:hypothetical protein
MNEFENFKGLNKDRIDSVQQSYKYQETTNDIETFYYYKEKSDINTFIKWFYHEDRFNKGKPYIIKRIDDQKIDISMLFFKNHRSHVDFDRYSHFDIIMPYCKPKYIKLMDINDTPIISLEQLFLELRSTA